MDCMRKSNPCAWIEGQATVENLIKKLMDSIVNAKIPIGVEKLEESTWKILYHEREHDYVLYNSSMTNQKGKYLHTDGREYEVLQLVDATDHRAKDDYGYINEIEYNAPGDLDDYSPYYTGRRIQVVEFSYGGETFQVPKSLAVVVEDRTTNLGYQAYMVKHSREDSNGHIVDDKNWNNYDIVAPLPDDWTYFLLRGKILYRRYKQATEHGVGIYDSRLEVSSKYSMDQIKFTPKYYFQTEKAVLQCNTSNGVYYLYFEKPIDSNNYIIVRYSDGLGDYINLIGNPEQTYLKACDLNTIGKGKTPKIINELEAYNAYERQQQELFQPGSVALKEPFSPPSYWFFSTNSTSNLMSNKMRDKDTLVRYWISFNNDRALVILEGDPNFEFESYLRSFGYFGLFIPLNPNDNTNFAVTVGMGDLDRSKTGFTLDDITKKGNEEYSKSGYMTSNGMDSISVYKGASGLPYQEYVPSFLTQMPKYSDKGELPSGLTKEEVNLPWQQVSGWTGYVHSSPIYLVNGYEGYRGYLDGIVAIHNIDLLNGEEMDWDNGENLETYVGFDITTPVCFLDKSPVPEEVGTLAIFKEFRGRW